MKKILMLLLAMILAFALVACAENAPHQEQTQPTNETPSEEDVLYDEEIQEPELKHFDLSIENGCLYVVYEDGQPDENVGHYDLLFSNHALMDQVSGTTEIDLSNVDLSDFDFVDIEVTAWDTTMCHSLSNMITYEVPKPVIEIPAIPTIAAVVYGEYAELSIQQVEGAEHYEIYINGNYCNSAYNNGEDIVIYTISPISVEVGLNEVFVCAANSAGASEYSETVTVGKLADPIYHSTGTGVEVIAGDVENAQGYALYGDDGAFIATMELSGSYDFSSLYTEGGFYMCAIQAVAEGWMSSQKCGIPVMVGDSEGPTGPIE